jgi:hypothetical protein
MRKTILLTVLCFCNILYLRSQDITGYVFNKSNTPIQFANVILLSAEDSTYISGCVTDSLGAFSIKTSHPEREILKVSCLGYKTVLTSIKNSKYPENIILPYDETSLQGITVTASRPVFAYQKGSLITSVAGTALARSYSVQDILEQIPGMVRTASGRLEVFGIGSPVIFINNRKVQSQSEINRLSPSSVKSIELITNPGAEYNAEGRAVLKITTLNKNDGLTLQLKGKFEQNFYPGTNENISIGYKFHKVDVNADLDYDRSQLKAIQPQETNLFSGSSNYYYKDDETEHQKNHNLEGHVSVDYLMTPKNTMGIEYNAWHNNNKSKRQVIFSRFLNNQPSGYSHITHLMQTRTNFSHINMFYNGEWTKHLQTQFNLDYVHHRSNDSQEVNEKETDNSAQTDCNGSSFLNIYAGKADFDYTFNNHIKISFGTEYNHTRDEGWLEYDTGRMPSTNFVNIENRSGTYVSTNIDLDRMSLEAGLRYETQESKYNNRIDNGENVNRKYFHFFPSFSISSKNSSWNNSLSFSSRTIRPTFRQLSNANYYITDVKYQQGNPLLKPSYLYILQWNTGYKWMSFNTSYTYQKNYLSTVFYSEPSHPGTIISSFTNYDKIQFLKTNLILQKNFSWWKPALTIGLLQPFFHCQYRGEDVSCNHGQLYFTVNQYFQLGKSYLLSLYYYHNSGGDQGAVRLKPYQMLNFNVQKSFWKDKLNVSFQAYDIFHTLKFKEKETINDIFFRQTEDYSLWNYSISFIYRLNTSAIRYKGKSSVKDDINRL